MKKLLFLLAAALLPSATLLAQSTSPSTADIALPAPNVAEPSAGVVQTLATRHSVRAFAATPLTLEQISNLCWAACGVSRDADHRTAPSAMNRQEIRLFVFTADAVYEYLAAEHRLALCAAGDHRDLVAGMPQRRQEFVLSAPVSLVLVADLEKFGRDDTQARIMASVDAGIVCQNVNLYCQSVGLATVPRATMDAAGISALLSLSEKQFPVMNNPVGLAR